MKSILPKLGRKKETKKMKTIRLERTKSRPIEKPVAGENQINTTGVRQEGSW